MRRRASVIRALVLACLLIPWIAVNGFYHDRAVAQRAEESSDTGWIKEIEEIFIPSSQCKQCHDRHYEEWKGMREQTPDLKTFGRVDAAMLHGTAFESPVFKTVLGLWLETDPTPKQRAQCLSCHAPVVRAFPQHTDRIVSQVLRGEPKVEGIGCTSCHLIKGTTKEDHQSPPYYELEAGRVLYGPYKDPEENLVHPSVQADIYDRANYCASCHFDKVKNPTRPDLPGEILKGIVCQDCHMEQSTGSSTSRRGALTRPIGRHWFRGVVIPGFLISNRNLQAEWMPRLDIETTETGEAQKIEGEVLVRNGSLPHSFPDGDPVLKQFFITIKIKDKAGEVLATEEHHFGLAYDQILKRAIPDPLVKGGTTRHIPFSMTVPAHVSPASIEAILTYALIPHPDPKLKERYLASLSNEKDREAAAKIIREYTQPRLLTFRSKSL